MSYKEQVESNSVRKLRSLVIEHNGEKKKFNVFSLAGVPVDASSSIQEKADEVKDRILSLKKGFSIRIPGTNYIVKV